MYDQIRQLCDAIDASGPHDMLPVGILADYLEDICSPLAAGIRWAYVEGKRPLPPGSGRDLDYAPARFWNWYPTRTTYECPDSCKVPLDSGLVRCGIYDKRSEAYLDLGRVYAKNHHR